MTGQILFIHGAGTGAYDEDSALAASLRASLGSEYNVAYPAFSEDPDYPEWCRQTQSEMDGLSGKVILVAHSAGAAMLIKYLSAIGVPDNVAGVFLLAAPYLGGNGWHYDGSEQIELPRLLPESLVKSTRVFFYHGLDDEIVPYDHLALYRKVLPNATYRQIGSTGHQFDGDLSMVAHDILAL